MAIKRHAMSGTLPSKVRHIYDVVQLWKHPEIQRFIKNKNELKNIMKETKENDHFYFEKRNIEPKYDATKPYDYDSWKNLINQLSIQNYERLHIDLLYTNQKQHIEEALNRLAEISNLLKSVEE
jgi:hypothetical protein